MVICSRVAGRYVRPVEMARRCLGARRFRHHGHRPRLCPSDTRVQYAEMGLVSFTRLAAILLPLQLACCYYLHTAPLALFFIVPASFLLFWVHRLYHTPRRSSHGRRSSCSAKSCACRVTLHGRSCLSALLTTSPFLQWWCFISRGCDAKPQG